MTYRFGRDGRRYARAGLQPNWAGQAGIATPPHRVEEGRAFTFTPQSYAGKECGGAAECGPEELCIAGECVAADVPQRPTVQKKARPGRRRRRRRVR